METVKNGQIAGLRPALNADGTLMAKPVTTWELSIANLAVSTQQYQDVDLGEEWHQYTLLSARKAGVSSAGEVLEIHFSTDGVSYQVAPAAYSSNGIAYTAAASPHMNISGRVVGRYARVRFMNGATQQIGTARLFLSASPY